MTSSSGDSDPNPGQGKDIAEPEFAMVTGMMDSQLYDQMTTASDQLNPINFVNNGMFDMLTDIIPELWQTDFMPYSNDISAPAVADRYTSLNTTPNLRTVPGLAEGHTRKVKLPTAPRILIAHPNPDISSNDGQQYRLDLPEPVVDDL